MTSDFCQGRIVGHFYLFLMSMVPSMSFHCTCHVSAAHAKDKYMAKYQDGRLNYQGENYSKGHHIIIDNKEDSPVQ